jgi:hypothetical protein
MAIGWLVFRENVDRRLITGAAAVLAGAVTPIQSLISEVRFYIKAIDNRKGIGLVPTWRIIRSEHLGGCGHKNDSGRIVLGLQLRRARSASELLRVAATPWQPDGKSIETCSNSADHPERKATKNANPVGAKSRNPHLRGGY